MSTDTHTLATLRGLVDDFYWRCFRADVASHAHAFMEFNGLLQKYLDLLREAEEQGVPLAALNQHSQRTVRVHGHHLDYLGEKLRCIFAPFIADPESARVLRDAIFGQDAD